MRDDALFAAVLFKLRAKRADIEKVGQSNTWMKPATQRACTNRFVVVVAHAYAANMCNAQNVAV
jgi:hypothetical protein